MKKIKLAEIEYDSPWAVNRFFPALRNEKISELFNLDFIAGVSSEEDVLDGMRHNLHRDLNRFFYSGYNDTVSFGNSLEVLNSLKNKGVGFFEINEGIPEQFFDNIDAVVLSKCDNWMDYACEILNHEKAIMLEGSLKGFLDEGGNIRGENVERLEEIVKRDGAFFMNLDEHAYSPEMVLGEKILEGILREGKKIKEIWGRSLEYSGDLFVLEDIAGLVGSVSLFGGKAHVVKREFDIYPGQKKHSYEAMDFEIEDLTGNFMKSARAGFRVGKFVDESRYDEKPEKRLEFLFEDDSELVVDFLNKGVYISKQGEIVKSYEVSREENCLINSLLHFNDCFYSGCKPRTDSKSYLRTLNSLEEATKIGDRGDYYLSDDRKISKSSVQECFIYDESGFIVGKAG